MTPHDTYSQNTLVKSVLYDLLKQLDPKAQHIISQTIKLIYKASLAVLDLNIFTGTAAGLAR